MMRVAFLDHYDSFSFNLIDCLFSDRRLEINYIPYDDREALHRLMRQPMPLIVSPGPKRPEALPETLSLMRMLLGKVPMLGVCLGHQCLGHILGGRIIRAAHPFHGSKQRVQIVGKNELMHSFSTGFGAAHYNSLVVDKASLPSDWVWAINEHQEIEGLIWEDGKWPAIGVQYHPESFLSEGQEALWELWAELVTSYYEYT